MGLGGTGCVDRYEVARQAVAGLVPAVRRLLEVHAALRRVDRYLELAPIAPGRPLMARTGQADGLDRPELFEVLLGHRQGIDEDSLAFLDDGVTVALKVDPVVVDREAIQAGKDFSH